MHILSPETDNCPSWISGRERMTVENISWSISTKECCRPRRELNPRPPGLQSDGASNWRPGGSLHYIAFKITLPWIWGKWITTPGEVTLSNLFCPVLKKILCSKRQEFAPRISYMYESREEVTKVVFLQNVYQVLLRCKSSRVVIQSSCLLICNTEFIQRTIKKV